MNNKYNQSEVNDINALIRTKDSNYWMNLREKKSIELFHEAAEHVPAYKDFLKKNKIDHRVIHSWNDFQSIPLISKKNYIKQYKLSDLCWNGKLTNQMVLTATSGSTGEPSYFLRTEKLDWQYSVLIEEYLLNNSKTIKGPTLVILCFGMGIWIGGLITYKAYEMAAIRTNLPISIITPGINKNEIFNSLRRLSPQYEQTILIGYGPFIKDIIDEAKNENINLKKLNVRFQFAAEAITEGVRDYLFKSVKMNNLYLDFLNIYGSADIGAMAAEYATSILVKRIAKKNTKIFNKLFPTISNSFTLAQFNPLFINFESHNGEIVLTGDNAIPLIRYSIGDSGGVLMYDEVNEILKTEAIDIEKEASKVGIKNQLSKLPFVFVYERRDFSTSFYGINVQPDWVRGALLVNPLADYVTGKFTLVTKYDKNHNQFLEINLELKKDKVVTQTFKKRAVNKIIAYMTTYSSEYRELCVHLKKKAYPSVQFWPSEDPLYFRPGVKQKWVQKS